MPDAIYFAQRAEESHAAMVAAADEGARLAHKQLECAYEALASSARHDRAAPYRRPGYGPRHDPAPRAKAPPADVPSGDAIARWDDEGGATR
jgi:hypothetical protein